MVAVALVVALGALTIAVDGSSAPAAASPAPASAVDFGNPLVPSSYRVRDADGGTQLHVFWGLVVDHAGLAAFATEVSDPTSDRYGHTATVPELAARFGPSAAGRTAFTGTLASVGATADVDVTGAFATSTLTVAQAEALFGVTFGHYDVGPNESVDAPDAMPTLPAALNGVVSYVRGLDRSIEGGAPPQLTHPDEPRTAAIPSTPPQPGGGGSPFRTGTAEGCSAALGSVGPFGTAPNQLRDAYGIEPLHRAGTEGQGVRLALVESGTFKTSDLAEYQACFGLHDAVQPTFHVTMPDPQDTIEATMDAEVLTAIAPKAERLDVFVNPLDTAWSMASFLSAPLDTTTTDGRLPDVVSVSYGICEAVLGHLGGPNLFPITEFVLATGAAAGVSWIVATGDSGSSSCLHNGYDEPAASPGYPSTSAWVTAVGGTNLVLTDDNALVSQGVWDEPAYWPVPGTMPTNVAYDAGTGGTSALIPRPTWQAGATVPAGPMRTVPDVAYFADALPGYLVRCTFAGCPSSGWTAEAGTSAATPLFAGVVALLTQEARAAGQPDPDFVTPLIYRLAAATDHARPLFWDVVVGTNDVADAGCCTAGPGYDLASGWGSLDAAALVEARATPGLTLATSAPSVPAGRPVTLTAAAVVPVGEPIAYRWDLDGDGAVDRITSDPTLTTTYTAASVVHPEVRVATTLGVRAVATAPLTITAPAATPVRATPTFTG